MGGARVPLAAPTPYGRQLLNVTDQFEGSQWWSPEVLQRYQYDHLTRLLAHAYETVPFHRKRLADAGYRLGQEVTPELWRRLPILKRSDIQDQGDAFQSTRVPPEHGGVFKVSTSGSTAMPLSVWRSDLHATILEAIVLRKAIWQDCDFRLKLGAVIWDLEGRWGAPAGAHSLDWGQPAALTYQTGPAVVIHSGSAPTELADWLVRERPDYLNIMPTPLTDVCFNFLDRDLTPPRLKGIMVHAEIVSPDLRELVRRTFGLELFASYGAREVGTIALQCPQHQHYHVQAESMLVEILDDDLNPCGPGETGTVILTPLHGYASPLLRYEIGDRAVVGRPCSCGRPHPVLTQIVGRTSGRVVLPSGMRRFCYFGGLRFLQQFSDLRQFQIVQRSLYDLEVRLVTRRRLTPDIEAEIARRVKTVTGEHFSVVFTYHDSIPLPPGGKFQDLVCEVDPADALGSAVVN